MVMGSINVNLKKEETTTVLPDFEWDKLEDTFEKIVELPRVETLFDDLDNISLQSNSNKNFLLTNNAYDQDMIIGSHDALSLGCYAGPNLYEYDSKQLVSTAATIDASHQSNVNIASNGSSTIDGVEDQKKRLCGRRRAVPLELEEIKHYFDLPITKAAKKMKVGLTVLKKRCRELNIMRWPHRKIKSLECLINNVKEMGLAKEVRMLEQNKKLIEKLPDVELTDETRKLRQACFKANYKKKRLMHRSNTRISDFRYRSHDEDSMINDVIN